MSSNRSTATPRHRPSRLLVYWIAGFLIVSAIASVTFFNLVREIVKNWNVTALAGPSATVNTSNEPGKNPAKIEVPEWQGIERVNVLLLGIDEREVEQGPWRTDTLIVLTIDPASRTAGMLSIPRDLWVPIPGFDESKINTAHFLGDATKYPGGGPALAMETVRYNLGIPVQYYLRLNFGGFEQLIDQIDGIDIYVEDTIDDPKYPDCCNGYDPLHIDQGWQHMDGALALKYARTRHNDMGDFGRAHHQQQVILAVRDKVLKSDMLPTLAAKAGSIADILGHSVQTNLSIDQLIRLAKLATQIDAKNIKQATIDENMVLAYNAPTDPPQDVLIPLRDKIRVVRDQIFGAAPMTTSISSGTPGGVRIVVENGTYVEGLAAKTADHLKSLGFNVISFTSADRFDYAQSRIININGQADTA
ncbi:MAG TPA: LCP family protein, partial [Anaerolineae bacterium]